MRRESAKTRTQSRERRAEEQRARTGATLRHRRRTFTCKSRRTANGGAPHVCDVIREERRRAPRGDPRRGPREGRSRAARRQMATPLLKRQMQASGSALQVLSLRANREARGERARTWKIILRLPRPPNAEPVARIAPRPSIKEDGETSARLNPLSLRRRGRPRALQSDFFFNLRAHRTRNLSHESAPRPKSARWRSLSRANPGAQARPIETRVNGSVISLR